jgi:hypothetical protein
MKAASDCSPQQRLSYLTPSADRLPSPGRHILLYQLASHTHQHNLVTGEWVS